ncbi:hypothetical protein SEVIR_8G231933v4 [Setaria viridis]|uniref:Uncharacterized protein n=1 Tax=Setaria viridis TaxID=4556 RepID=A0A4U6TIK0_SETVI|nr:hypothetical protein SEVIR_8G231933v2 [Setaria viridis]
MALAAVAGDVAHGYVLITLPRLPGCIASPACVVGAPFTVRWLILCGGGSQDALQLLQIAVTHIRDIIKAFPSSGNLFLLTHFQKVAQAFRQVCISFSTTS